MAQILLMLPGSLNHIAKHFGKGNTNNGMNGVKFTIRQIQFTSLLFSPSCAGEQYNNNQICPFH